MTTSKSPESEKPGAAPEKAATAEATTTTTTSDKVDAPVTQNESTPDSAVSQTPKIHNPNSPNAAATTAATDTTKKVRGSDTNTARPPIYYPYPPYYPFPFRDPAFEIAKKAAAHKNGSPNSKGDPSSPTSPASAAESAVATPSSLYPHPHPYFHPHAAAAYHQWAAAGYYDPYAAAMAYANNNNSKSPASEASPHPMPYRYSDHSLRRDAISHHGSPSEKNQSSPGTEAPGGEHPNMAYMMDIEARADGATSPSQIEDFHREEVTSMGCTCKKTKCLKLYCQCFGVKIYCGQNCRCLTCHNLPQFDLERETAIRIILTRNPNAFETKFQKNGGHVAIRPTELAPQQPGSLPLPAKTLSHKLGCKCRKSACMKKYCECYAGNVKCSSNCRCQGCKNQPPGGKKDGDKSITVTETASRKDPARHEAAYSLVGY
jgi:Tesmin/TSO1-like CXC domain, cysteine-rich domain